MLATATGSTAPTPLFDADKKMPRRGFWLHNLAQIKLALLTESSHVVTRHHHWTPRSQIPFL